MPQIDPDGTMFYYFYMGLMSIITALGVGAAQYRKARTRRTEIVTPKTDNPQQSAVEVLYPILSRLHEIDELRIVLTVDGRLISIHTSKENTSETPD